MLMVEAEQGIQNLLDPRGSLFAPLTKPVEFFERVVKSPSYREQVALKLTEQLRNPHGIPLATGEALALVKNRLSLSTSKTSDFMEMKARFWVERKYALTGRWGLNEKIKSEFNREGIAMASSRLEITQDRHDNSPASD